MLAGPASIVGALLIYGPTLRLRMSSKMYKFKRVDLAELPRDQGHTAVINARSQLLFSFEAVGIRCQSHSLRQPPVGQIGHKILAAVAWIWPRTGTPHPTPCGSRMDQMLFG